MLGQTFSTWEIEKYWQSGTSLGEKHHATPCDDQENVEICRRGWHSWDGFFETWTTGCAFSPLLVQGFSCWTMYSGVCCLRCDVFSRKSLQVQRRKPLNQRSKQLTFYTILSFMHGHPAVFVVGSGIRIRPSHVSEATPEQGILNKNGVQCVFLGLASPFLGISQWVLGLGHTCRSPRTESSGFGGCTYPGRPDVVQGRVQDVEGLVWSWGTLQRCSGCHVVCQPLHSWLQQGFNGPDICLWWERAHSGWRRSHQDDLWQLAMPGAQSCRLLSRPKCVCCGWVVHGHHAWEVGCMGHGQRWPHSKLRPVWPSIQWANWSHRSARKRQQCHGGRFESDPWCHLWQLHGRCCQWYPVARPWVKTTCGNHRTGAAWSIVSRDRAAFQPWPRLGSFANAFVRRAPTRDRALSQWWHHGTAIGLWPELGLHRPHLWCVALHLCESSAQGRVLHWTMVGQLPMPSHIHEDTGHEPRLGHWVLTNSVSAVPRWGSFAHDLQVLDGSFSTFTQGVRNVTYNIFQALWPRHLVGEYPTLDQLYQHMWNQTDLDLAALKPEECAAGAEVDGRISKALAMVGSWSHRPNLLWSLIHFVMHNQPSPMSSQAVAASEALANHLSENFWCNDCRGFFTIGVLGTVGLPPRARRVKSMPGIGT